MSNFFLDIAAAIKGADDSYRNSFVTDGAGTIKWAFNLMSIQSAWQPILDNDTFNAVQAGLPPPAGQGNPGLAAYYQGQYQVDSQAKDAQSSVWEQLVQTDQTQINNVGDARKGNFGLADGMASTEAQCISVENF